MAGAREARLARSPERVARALSARPRAYVSAREREGPSQVLGLRRQRRFLHVCGFVIEVTPRGRIFVILCEVSGVGSFVRDNGVRDGSALCSFKDTSEHSELNT